jgi:ketosteroid isomerase-like protein
MTNIAAVSAFSREHEPLSQEQLVDLEAIKALTHRYALSLDRFDIDGVVDVFASDCVFDASPFGLPLMEGRAQIREFFEHNEQSMASQMHLFANHIIEFDGADEAHGTNYLYEDGYTKEGNRITCLGINEDRYVRAADGWRIAYRKIAPLVPPKLEGY